MQTRSNKLDPPSLQVFSDDWARLVPGSAFNHECRFCERLARSQPHAVWHTVKLCVAVYNRALLCARPVNGSLYEQRCLSSSARLFVSGQSWCRYRHLIPRAAFEFASDLSFSCSAPLLEEKGNVRVQALVANFCHPSRVHGAGAGAAPDPLSPGSSWPAILLPGGKGASGLSPIPARPLYTPGMRANPGSRSADSCALISPGHAAMVGVYHECGNTLRQHAPHVRRRARASPRVPGLYCRRPGPTPTPCNGKSGERPSRSD